MKSTLQIYSKNSPYLSVYSLVNPLYNNIIKRLIKVSLWKEENLLRQIKIRTNKGNSCSWVNYDKYFNEITSSPSYSFLGIFGGYCFIIIENKICKLKFITTIKTYEETFLLLNVSTPWFILYKYLSLQVSELIKTISDGPNSLLQKGGPQISASRAVNN